MFMHRLKKGFRRAINAVGYDLVGFDYTNARARLRRTLERLNIRTVLDVGANHGALGWSLRELGYRGNIVSFEPLPEPFRELSRRAAADSKWKAVQIGLGDRNLQMPIHVSANSLSSSCLPMLETHENAAPQSRYQGTVMAEIRRLDEVFQQYCPAPGPVFLKVDTQGFERKVLEGAAGILGGVPLVQLECSLVPLYEGGDLIEDMIGWMRGQGYDPTDMSAAFFHEGDGRLMQTDILFERRKAHQR
ncbi:MAG TPA: FkbM family methyltransferase [Hyphomicrobiales bacterium]|nr:FkbM family methyltransferase [Hyphomicrobiales bacterium]